jgi:hypothetical protein
MSKPRYKVFISLQKDGSYRYYFEDTDPPFKYKDKYDGQVFLYEGAKKDFVSMVNPHDAIVFCNELNEREQNK